MSLPLSLANPLDACTPLAEFVTDEIVLVRRGTFSFAPPSLISSYFFQGGCTFYEKALHVQAAGGRAILVSNNVGSEVFSMSGAEDVPLNIFPRQLSSPDMEVTVIFA